MGKLKNKSKSLKLTEEYRAISIKKPFIQSIKLWKYGSQISILAIGCRVQEDVVLMKFLN